MLHDAPDYVAAVGQERLRQAARRRIPADAGELERLVLAAEGGDESAWRDLVKRFSSHVRRVARAHGLSQHDAEDVGQETWLRLFKNIGRIHDARVLGAWLGTTARRESLHTIVARRGEELTDMDLRADLAAPDDLDEALTADARRAALVRALDRLPERHRKLMASLLADPAPSYDEVAAELGIPRGSIGPIRGRCVARIRDDLAPERSTFVLD